ncbi:MAG TPA: hypothetical protein VGM05_03065 [Planctomycetaceae bacterium]|jgi:hypothetical protein
MAAIFPVLAVAFAAFCIWLGVRFYNRRECWSKWTLAGILGLPLLYVASFGPACRSTATPWLGRGIPLAQIPRPSWMNLYRPLCWLSDRYQGSFFSTAILKYVEFSIPQNSLVAIQMDSDDSHLWIVAK